MEKYIKLIHQYSKNTYKRMHRKPNSVLKYPFIVPGSDTYNDCLWDWDSWLTNVAVRQIMADNADYDEEFIKSEKGCILNFLDNITPDGRIPIVISQSGANIVFEKEGNIHKPCLLQHLAFVCDMNNKDVSWILPYKEKLKCFVNFYVNNCRHKETGLYFWLDDRAIGVDNDPCTFYRPKKSSASIYLNCLMYRELCAIAYILKQFGESSHEYAEEAENLKNAVREHLWDERNGFYYSADINLLPIDMNSELHQGSPRHWHSVIQKIDVWSGFMAMWAGIATKEQAQRMVNENMLNPKIFWAPYGVRTLSKLEKMYCIKKSGNPSCWLGPIWGISNWMCFKGLVDYGFINEAREIAEKTVYLFGKDIEKCGELHEYYHPESGEGVNNMGFQNWNLLVNNMIAWLEKRDFITEFSL